MLVKVKEVKEAVSRNLEKPGTPKANTLVLADGVSKAASTNNKNHCNNIHISNQCMNSDLTTDTNLKKDNISTTTESYFNDITSQVQQQQQQKEKEKEIETISIENEYKTFMIPPSSSFTNYAKTSKYVIFKIKVL